MLEQEDVGVHDRHTLSLIGVLITNKKFMTVSTNTLKYGFLQKIKIIKRYNNFMQKKSIDIYIVILCIKRNWGRASTGMFTKNDYPPRLTKDAF